MQALPVAPPEMNMMMKQQSGCRKKLPKARTGSDSTVVIFYAVLYCLRKSVKKCSARLGSTSKLKRNMGLEATNKRVQSLRRINGQCYKEGFRGSLMWAIAAPGN